MAIICACLPTFRPLFDRRVRRSSTRGQSVELAAHGSLELSNRKSGYVHMEGKANDKFLDLVSKNWAAVPSARNSSKADCDVEERSVEEWQAKHEGV